MKHALILLTLTALLIMAGGVLAMSSDNYRLDWFTPLTGSAGGPASSTHYAVSLTVGQSVVGLPASENYQACLGYRCGTGRHWRVYLPLVVRQSL